MLIDVTCVHPIVASRIQEELKRTKERIASAAEAKEKGKRDPMRHRPGAAVEKAAREKHEKYEPLLNAMRKQVTNRHREAVPKFFGAAMTTHGEFGDDTIRLVEWITRAYGRRISREADDEDGVSRTSKTALFRRQLRAALQAAVARGYARMLNECGLPRASVHYVGRLRRLAQAERGRQY